MLKCNTAVRGVGPRTLYLWFQIPVLHTSCVECTVFIPSFPPWLTLAYPSPFPFVSYLIASGSHQFKKETRGACNNRWLSVLTSSPPFYQYLDHSATPAASQEKNPSLSNNRVRGF